jgi:protoporphyrin/coproporphyrin ferrochelatase
MEGDRPTGVLLINLGTPEAPTPRKLRPYLREFLGDPFVEFGPPKPVWWMILNLIVLPFRPRKSAAMYQKVWTDEGAPLTVFSLGQQRALAAKLGESFRVEFGYRYGEPSIATAMSRLANQKCQHVVVIPLFPQDSSSSYGTSVKDLERVIEGWGRSPAPSVTIVEPFFDDPGYIRAMAKRIKDATAKPVEHYVFSFHGIPVSFIERGENYQRHCEATSAALAKELGLSPNDWTLAYQSKFGKAEWLSPATADLIAELGTKHRRILVACPGFLADCLETIEEIGILNADIFREHGGEELVLAPALNDSPEWVEAMARMVRDRTIAGVAA